MSDDGRRYSDEEFALILRTAVELASRHDGAGGPTQGLTLTDMKAAAAQVGVAPALMEEASRLIATRRNASGSARLIGGPLRHEHSVRYAIELDAQRAARLLSAVRINTDVHGPEGGHSSELGMTWSASTEGDVLSVSARPDAEGVAVTVVLDRTGTFFIAGLVASLTMLMAGLFCVFALGQASLALAVGGLLVSGAGIGAALRGFWSATTRKAQRRIGMVLDAVDRVLGA